LGWTLIKVVKLCKQNPPHSPHTPHMKYARRILRIWAAGAGSGSEMSQENASPETGKLVFSREVRMLSMFVARKSKLIAERESEMSVFADRFSPKLGQDRAQLRVRSAKKRVWCCPSVALIP
jgi:hypothetical protein